MTRFTNATISSGLAMPMVSVLVRGLDFLARFFYWSDHARFVRSGMFLTCAVVFVAMGMAQSARLEDRRIYPLPPAVLRATLVDRYVTTTGKFLYDGAYDVHTNILGAFGQTQRFIPFTSSDAKQSLLVVDENLPTLKPNEEQLTLIGRLLPGTEGLPEYYLKVGNPAPVQIYDALILLCLIFYVIVILGTGLNWFVRKLDYAITMPIGRFDIQHNCASSVQPLLLWFGSLGAAYGDVVLRQVPVSFRAIPAEARLFPAQYPDLWAVIIKRLRLVQLTTVATSYGALPAVRVEFEDERGITRNAVVAASKSNLLQAILDVLRFIGQ